MILNEIQKAIIFGSSIRIKTPIGFIEIYRGDILNAEKNDSGYGIDAFLDIVKNSKEYELEVLDEMPITTINEGWQEIKNRIFENNKLLFKNLVLDEGEIFKFIEWIKARNFSGFIINKDVIEVIKDGNTLYSLGIFKENQAFNVYEFDNKLVSIFLRSVVKLNEDEISKTPDIRKEFAMSGESGIILSYERLEVFEKGIRVLNLVDELPIDVNKVVYGFEQEFEIKPQETPFLTDKDLKLLAYILENSMKLLSEKVGKEAVEKAIEKYKPDVNNPQSVINCIKEVMERAKIIGGTGWLKKNINKISDGVSKVTNEELRKLLNELFRV